MITVKMSFTALQNLGILDKEVIMFVWDDNLYDAMKDVYDYAYRVFFGKAPIDVIYRMNYGSRGAEEKVLQYIWDTYIEPKGENHE